jgi:CheY-like chemotaxis protein
VLQRQGHDGARWPHALSLVSKGRPDLVLLDLLMPGMDGFDFIEYLRELKDVAPIPVIAVTA